MSSRKNIIRPYQLITSGDMSGDIESAPVNVQFLDNTGIEVTWTGTPTGTFQVLASISGETFYPLTFDPPLGTAAGAADGFLINLNQLPFTYFKVKYIATSSTGTLNAYITVKEI